MDNGSLCHVEYFVTDLARSQAYYAALFGWDFRAFGDSMVVFGQGDCHIGGLMLKSNSELAIGGSPSLWFKVGSLERAGEASQALGGGGLSDKHPVPGVGMSAVVTDPDGNAVGLVQYDE
ncbi:MAG: VOC family protein [Fimbriimonadaceae bacterium]